MSRRVQRLIQEITLHLEHRIPKLLTSAHWPAPLLHSGLFFQNLWKQVTDVMTKYLSLRVWEECTFVSYMIRGHFTPTAPWSIVVVVVVQWINHDLLFVTPWTALHQTSLSLTISRSLPKFMSIESVMLTNHLPPSTIAPLAFTSHLKQGFFFFFYILWGVILVVSSYSSPRVFSRVLIPVFWERTLKSIHSPLFNFVF